MTDRERDQKLLQMCEDIAEIKVKVSSDYRAIYGNGKPGLLEDMKNITERVVTLEAKEKERQHHYGVLAGVIGFIINSALAIWAALKHQT